VQLTARSAPIRGETFECVNEAVACGVGDEGDGGVPHGVGSAVADTSIGAERQGKNRVWQPRELVVHLHSRTPFDYSPADSIPRRGKHMMHTITCHCGGGASMMALGLWE
jgi:hypothetical protein